MSRGAILFALVFAIVQTARADTPVRYLHCEGYSKSLNGTITHDIAIYRDRAAVDDELYFLHASPLYFQLKGPFKSLAAAGLITPSNVIDINRITGEYLILDASNQGTEWSRDGDKGCQEVRPKF